MENEGNDIRGTKESVSLYLSTEVLQALDAKSDDLERSRSWIANDALKRGLGMEGGGDE